MSQGSKHRPSTHSSWENDSDPELAQEPWEVGSNYYIWIKPLAPEEDEWDELTVLELPPEEDHQQKRRIFVADVLLVPIPRSEQDSTKEASDCEVPWDTSSHPDMSQREYNSDTELSPGVEYGDQELVLWEKDITFCTGNRALSPVMEEEQLQPCFLKGSASVSPMGTVVVAEVAPALPRASCPH
ncbi:hypothetical protein Nmel_008599 [Mimus melanotis]